MREQAKQINKVLSSPVQVNSFTANGASANATTAITAALSTAGSGGRAVPLQVSTDDFTMGVETNNWICPIEDAATKDPIEESGYEVYGRLSESSGVYTLTWFYDADGTETAYTFASPVSINFRFCYMFDFDRYPPKTACSIISKMIEDDPSSQSGRPFAEELTPTGTNTLPNLTYTPTNNTPVFLIVNGHTENSLSGGGFSVSGKALTWSVANAEYDLATTDEVIAFYWTRD